MKPICLYLDSGFSLIIVPEINESDCRRTATFQLYYSGPGNTKNRLSDLNNYSGMISFDRISQEFYYTPGNLVLSDKEIRALIGHIKTKIG